MKVFCPLTGLRIWESGYKHIADLLNRKTLYRLLGLKRCADNTEINVSLIECFKGLGRPIGLKPSP